MITENQLGMKEDRSRKSWQSDYSGLPACRPLRSPGHLPWIAVSIAVLLAVLAVLQQRSVGQLTTAERERLRMIPRDALERVIGDFHGAIDRLWYVLHIAENRAIADELADNYAGWLDSADQAEWIRGIYYVEEVDRRVRLRRFRPEDRQLEDVAWPRELRGLRVFLNPGNRWRGPQRVWRNRSFVQPLRNGELALVVFQEQLDTASWAIGWLNSDVIFDQLIPKLVEKHFGTAAQADYVVGLIRDDGEPSTIGERGRGATESMASAGPASFWGGSDVLFGRLLDLEYSRMFGPGPMASAVPWRIVAEYAGGSPETAVLAFRRRHLAANIAVVLLLACSVVMLLVAAYRARGLARQQLAFVGGVSHELRTPLNGISTLSENLTDGIVLDPARVMEYGAAIKLQARRLADMLEAVLALASSRASRISPAPRPINVGDMIREVLAIQEGRQPERRNLEADIPDNTPCVVADERAVRSALHNLISNAIKHGDGAKISIRARFVENTRGDEVQITVEDNGPGIPKADLDRVFEPFYRGRAAIQGQVAGSGLGLAVVKESVEVSGGRVSVESRPAAGTAFTIHLPATDRSMPPAASEG